MPHKVPTDPAHLDLYLGSLIDDRNRLRHERHMYRKAIREVSSHVEYDPESDGAHATSTCPFCRVNLHRYAEMAELKHNPACIWLKAIKD